MTEQIEAATKAMKEQLAKLAETFKIPGVNIDTLMESHRKNVEAMSKASQLTAEGAAAISQRQLEILRATSEQLTTALRDMKLSSQQQGEFARKAFETALASTRELAEMTVKSNTEVFNVVKQRMTEDFEQMRTAFFSGQSKK
ncbi:TIGR01841 family phasin [Bradyrhizobium manausense]|uniref:phasin family protein n=1 Tax=Bradyrhizobium manausense TaxID=989370 RepID=UPI001BA53DC5|nr:TIGR01841 family phasin [Bradyrhizobium manausense]MBR0825602.1 TIGR01841 family phasin [Bradyrhizobium manausense]